jgi:hypothetical protein
MLSFSPSASQTTATKAPGAPKPLSQAELRKQNTAEGRAARAESRSMRASATANGVQKRLF